VSDDFEELSARARRQALSATDAEALAQSLETSAEARLWHRVGAEFDAEDTALPGDREATERVLARLLRELPAQKTRSRRRVSVPLLAAALLVASAAAATVLGLRQRPGPARVNEQVSSVPPAATPLRQGWSGALAAPPEPSAQPAVPNVEPPAPTPVASASNGTSSPSPMPASAAELLSAAGRARREGYAGQAITLLESLQARFPNSPEARASDITLGMLQLKSGSASAARQHFERYLERSPQGALAVDALWGRAQALSAQGNEREARATLSTLLERFPNTAYASAARAKLRAP
jgi:TolA-binding protein